MSPGTLITEAVSKVGDSLFLFGYLMERYMRLSNSQRLHDAFETASFFLYLQISLLKARTSLFSNIFNKIENNSTAGATFL